MLGKEHLRAAHQAADLPGRNRLLWRAQRMAMSRFHFDKHNGLTGLGNEVQLTVLAAPVTCKDAVAQRLQVRLCPPFPLQA